MGHYDPDKVMDAVKRRAEKEERDKENRICVPPHEQRRRREQAAPEYVVTNAYSRERV